MILNTNNKKSRITHEKSDNATNKIINNKEMGCLYYDEQNRRNTFNIVSGKTKLREKKIIE